MAHGNVKACSHLEGAEDLPNHPNTFQWNRVLRSTRSLLKSNRLRLLCEGMLELEGISPSCYFHVPAFAIFAIGEGFDLRGMMFQFRERERGKGKTSAMLRNLGHLGPTWAEKELKMA